MEGKKFDNEKPVMSLLPFDALREVGRVLTHGQKKYGAYNWKQGMDWSRPTSALIRHLEDWMNGNDLDYDSGCLLLAQVATNALFLLSYQLNGIGNDDRFKISEEQEEHLKEVKRQVDEAVQASKEKRKFLLKLK
jgi:hypothetical protein